MKKESKLATAYTASYTEAQIIKSKLESEGIPAMLQYESAGLIYGFTVDGLGQAKVLVPEQFVPEARGILGE